MLRGRKALRSAQIKLPWQPGLSISPWRSRVGDRNEITGGRLVAKGIAA
nr:hypothetical protein CDS [Bradyrhizobium sp.]